MIKSICEIDKYGNKRWYNEKRELHRLDGPAIEKIDGDRFYYYNGRLHRENGPAIEYYDGTTFWYYNHKYYSVSSAEELMIAVLIG